MIVQPTSRLTRAGASAKEIKDHEEAFAALNADEQNGVLEQVNAISDEDIREALKAARSDARKDHSADEVEVAVPDTESESEPVTPEPSSKGAAAPKGSGPGAQA